MSDTSNYPNQFDAEKWFLPAVNNLEAPLVATLSVTNNNAIRIASTVGWPTEGVVSIGKEVIYYLGLNPTSFLTLIRGFDNTVPSEHRAGDVVQLRWIAAHHNRTRNAVMTLQSVLGINPQGAYPDVATRLGALFGSVNSRTNIVPVKHDQTTPTKTGYSGGPHLSRMFLTPEKFVITNNFGPKVVLDGIEQSRSIAVKLFNDQIITSIDVDNGSGKGIITCTGTTFTSSLVAAGDIVVLKGTPNNDDAYIVDQVVSDTQLRMTEVIFGSDQPSAATGLMDIYDVDNATNPMEDYIATSVINSDAGLGDGLIFNTAPVVLQQIRVDYDAQGSGISVQYTTPIAALADYEDPVNTGTLGSMGTAVFTLLIGRTRAIIYKINLTGSGMTISNNIKIEVFGRADFTELQYEADFVDVSTVPFIDYGLWHFTNKEDTPVPEMTVRLTNLTTDVTDYSFEIQAEALGNNI